MDHFLYKTRLFDAIRTGLQEGGIGVINETELNDVFAGFSFPGGTDWIQEAARRHARDLAKQRGLIVDWVDLDGPGGLIYLIDRAYYLDIDYTPPPATVLAQMDVGPVELTYAAEGPAVGGQCRVRMAIGRMTRSWTEEELSQILLRPGCPVQGSGAWVMQAFRASSFGNQFDEDVWFPDPTSSRWEHCGASVYPRLRRDGSCSIASSRQELKRRTYLALLWPEPE